MNIAVFGTNFVPYAWLVGHFDNFCRCQKTQIDLKFRLLPKILDVVNQNIWFSYEENIFDEKYAQIFSPCHAGSITFCLFTNPALNS